MSVCVCVCDSLKLNFSLNVIKDSPFACCPNIFLYKMHLSTHSLLGGATI